MREYTEVEGLQGTYSDMFKDVHGFRPRHLSEKNWNSRSYLKEAIEELSKELEAVMECEKAIELEAIATFEKNVDNVIASGAGDRKTALRWIFAAENDAYTEGDKDYFCYLHGLPYGYFKNEVSE